MMRSAKVEAAIRSAESAGATSPTLNQLVAMVDEINTANGWRGDRGEVLTEKHPMAQIAALTPINMATADVAECIRNPDKGGGQASHLGAVVKWADYIACLGIQDAAQYYVKYIARGEGASVYGSKVEALARLRLIDTETAEASEAVINGDTANLAEELADIAIRVVDFAGAWNEAHPDKPIDLEAAILAKLAKNKARGYRHGGKLA